MKYGDDTARWAVTNLENGGIDMDLGSELDENDVEYTFKDEWKDAFDKYAKEKHPAEYKQTKGDWLETLEIVGSNVVDELYAAKTEALETNAMNNIREEMNSVETNTSFEVVKSDYGHSIILDADYFAEGYEGESGEAYRDYVADELTGQLSIGDWSDIENGEADFKTLSEEIEDIIYRMNRNETV